MKRYHFNRRTPLVILFLFIALALVLVGAYRGGSNDASAATAPTGIDITPTTSPFLMASSYSPADGATGVAVDANVTVKFNKDLKSSTINTTSFSIKKSGAASNLAATVTYSNVTDIATLNPQFDLLPGTLYEATLTADIKNSTSTLSLHNPGTWTFTTDTAPEIVVRTPAQGATGVPVGQVIAVTFNRDMKPASITSGSFTLQKQGGPVLMATVVYNAPTQTATLTPPSPLDPDSTYVVTLTAAIKSEAGLSLNGAPVAWSFVTGSSAPTVTTKVPTAGASGVPTGQVIAVTFDMDMNPATITNTSFRVAKSGGSAIAGAVAYSAGTRTATFTPASSLEAGATYEVTLTSAIQSAGGLSLSGAPVTWTFATAAAAPAVASKTPAAGATGVPVSQAVTATFDRDMDAATITNATFTLKKLSDSPLAATVTYDAGTRTATLTPSAPLEAGTAYQATLSSAVHGSDGQTLTGAPYAWTFTTADSGSDGIVFSDVAGSPYETAIYALAHAGAVTGYENGTFDPNAFVKRQQFAKMIVLTLGLTVTGAEHCPFTDVQTQTGLDPFYPSKYVAVCAAENITKGKTATLFAPYDNITHQQLITMVVRAAGLTPPIGYLTTFAAAQFSLQEHYLNALAASAAGLLDGLVGIGPAYNFLAGSTRGECAQILYNLMLLMQS